MKLRSLSIAVPTKGCGKNGKGCLNDCMFCVSAMDDNEYPNLIESNEYLYERDYINRINFCLERNFEALILTGTGEPILNIPFLERVAHWNRETLKPFRWIEIQTSGVTLNDDKLKFLRNTLGTTGISLSLSSIFDSDINAAINRTPDQAEFDIDHLCHKIKNYGFNLRLSLNMWSYYNDISPEKIFNRAKDLGANQITFRILYTSDKSELPQNVWINEHKYVRDSGCTDLDHYIKHVGHPLEKMSIGTTRYDVNGMSVLVDFDCMDTEVKEDVRYLILRPDCKLYTKWGSKGSLLF